MYPLYVLRALSCDESIDDRDVTREVLSEEDFRSLSTEGAVTELQALGVPLQQAAASLSTLFPGGTRFYVPMFKTSLLLDLTGMSLEDVLCHIRIVGKRLYRFGMRPRKISK